MINILFLLSHTEKGGGEVVIYNLIKNLERSRFRPFLGHVDFRRGEFIHEFKKLGVEPVDFHAGRLRNLPVALSVVLRLSAFIRNNAIDVVFTSGAHNHIYAALAKRITRVPVVTYVMNYYQSRLKDNPLIMRLAVMLGADYYFLNSFTGLESLKRIIPAASPCKVVYHGVDDDFIYGEDNGWLVRKQLGLSDKDKLISVVARLQPWKGQDVFLRAAALIVKAHPEAYFCLVGGALFGMDQDYPGELQRLIDNLGLSGRCRMAGHQDNARDWISASDIIVHSTVIPDAASVVIREAMFLGKPVVATSEGATLEFIEDGISGILCKPGSPDELALKVIKLLDDAGLAARISHTAKGIASERFSAQGMNREIEGVLVNIVPKPQEKKRVLFTFSSCSRSGHETSMRNVINVLDRREYEPLAVFLCLRQEGAFPEELRKMGMEVVVKNIGRLRNPFSLLRTVCWLSGFIKAKQVKLVFSSGGHNHVYSRLAALLARRPVIAHETFNFKEYLWQNNPIQVLDFLLSADAYVSCGRFASDSLRRACLWKRPVYALPPMVDTDIFDYRKSGLALRQRLNVPADAFVFSMVARIQEWKGQDIFVEAALQILKESPATYFLIFGEPTFDEDGAYLGLLKEKVRSAGCPEQVIFAGLIEDSAYAYAASDVICHCSKNPEPFGLVVIEAFAMKKPVIATAVGGPLESVEDGKDGYLIPPASPADLASAMRQCLKEKERLKAMGEYGYKKAVEVYSRQHFSSGINPVIAKYIRK